MAGNSHYARAILGLDTRRFKQGVKGAKRSWGNFTRGMMGSIGPMVGAAGLGLLASKIIGIGVTFEQQMQNIKAVTRSSTEEMQLMERAARQLGAQTSFSAVEVAEGMTVLAKATGSASKAVQGIEAVLKLAGSEGANMAETAELMISSMNAFGISFSESARVANVFAATAQTTRMSVDRLKDSMKGIATIGREFGLAFEETTAAVAILVDSGAEAASAGVQLRSALADILRATGPLADAMKGVNVETDGLVGVLDALSDAGIKGTETFKKFNVRGAQSIAVLIRQRDRFVELTEKITGTNAAWEAYNTQMDSTGMAWKRVQSALSEVSIAIFKTFGTDLKKFLDAAAFSILENRDAIVIFALDTIKFLKLAMFEVRTYGSVFGEMLTALKAAMETVDIGDAIEKALIPQIGPKWKLLFAAMGNDIQGAAKAWEEILGDGGENAAEAFASAFMESFGGTADEIKAAREAYHATVEAEHKIHIERLRDMSMTSKFEAPELDETFLTLREVLDQHWAAVKLQSLEAGVESGRAFMRGLSAIEAADFKAAIKDMYRSLRQEAQQNSHAIREIWGTMFDAITDIHITGSERWKEIIGGAMSVITRMLKRMIAEAIATKIQLEAVFGNMTTGGLLLSAFGLGFLGSVLKFHEGGLAPGLPGGEQLAVLKNREFVMPPGPSAQFLPQLEAMRAGRLPQLSAAGGGGMSIHGHVHVPSGSILYANDPMGIRSIAEMVNREIEETVKRAYRE